MVMMTTTQKTLKRALGYAASSCRHVMPRAAAQLETIAIDDLASAEQTVCDAIEMTSDQADCNWRYADARSVLRHTLSAIAAAGAGDVAALRQETAAAAWSWGSWQAEAAEAALQNG
jgi:hypothetical protein